jgi:hypothetical protein
MDPASRFELACRKHSINLSSSSTPSSQLSLSLKQLEEFHLFPKLPYEIRRKIWKLAIKALPPRVVHIHPHPTNNPGLAYVCFESRKEFSESKAFWLCAPNKHLARTQFRAMINYDADMLYLDRRVKYSKNPDGNPIPTTLLIFRHWLLPVRQLAINLRDTRAFLPQIFGQASWYKGRCDINLWRILGANCPDLKFLWIVDNGPFEKGYDGELNHDNQWQLKRSTAWNMMWRNVHQSLMWAKYDGDIQWKLHMRPMDMNKMIPLPVPL